LFIKLIYWLEKLNGLNKLFISFLMNLN